MADSLIVPRPLTAGLTRVYKGCVCVYEHRTVTGSGVFYVGSGTSDRPWGFDHRNKIWRQIVVDNGNKFEANIIGWFVNDDSARDYEILRIKELKPIANQMHNGWKNPHTNETKIKLRDARIGRPNPSAAYPLAEETKRKLSEAHNYRKRPVEDIDSGILYSSISAACKALNLRKSGVQSSLKGRVTRHKGYRFRYARELVESVSS